MATQKPGATCNDTRILDNQRENMEQRRLDKSQDHEQQPQPQQQQQQQQQQEPSDNVNVNNVSPQNIVAELNAIIENRYFDRILKLPAEFADENSCNPLEFLDEVDRYFRIKRISENNKLNIISALLDGKARHWFEMQTEFQNYQAFQAAFIQRFYMMSAQLRQKIKWLNGKFDPKNHENLQFYYFSQLRKSNFLRPIMMNYEKNYSIIQQLPRSVRQILATVDCNDNDLITQTLSNLDTVFTDLSSSTSNLQEFRISPA